MRRTWITTLITFLVALSSVGVGTTAQASARFSTEGLPQNRQAQPTTSHSHQLSEAAAAATSYKMPFSGTWVTGSRSPSCHKSDGSTCPQTGPYAFDLFPTGGASRKVLAAASGTITRTCLGNQTVNVRLTTSTGVSFNYFHVDKSSAVTSGAVAQGTVLGEILPGNGSFSDLPCGVGTAPHLHFEVPTLPLTIDGQTFSRGTGPGARFTSTNVPPTKPAFTRATPTSTLSTGQSYSYQFQASGTPTPRFSIHSGSLPPGLTLSSSGLLSGRPTTAGTFRLSVRASNTVGSVTTPNLNMTVFGIDFDGDGIADGPKSGKTDVNDDGLPDVVGFANSGVRVALNTGTNFAPTTTWASDFGYITGGWRVEKHPRLLGSG
jgi:murein DD-endopeptidase MepM/ murein hydrolase activator NlpD